MKYTSFLISQGDSGRRKLIAIIVAGSCSVLMTFAFISGGPKTPALKDTEKDPTVGVLQDLDTSSASGGSALDEWLIPSASGISTPGSKSADSSPPPAQTESSVVLGDPIGTAHTVSQAKPSTTRPLIATAPAAKSHQPSLAAAATPTSAPPSKQGSPVSPETATVLMDLGYVGGISRPPYQPGQPASRPPMADSPARVQAPLPLAAAPPSSAPIRSQPPLAQAKTPAPSRFTYTPPRVSPLLSHQRPPCETDLDSARIQEPWYLTDPHLLSSAPTLATADSQPSLTTTTPPHARYRPIPPSKLPKTPHPTPHTTPSPPKHPGRSTPARVAAVLPLQHASGLVVDNSPSLFTPEGIPLRTDLTPGISPLTKLNPDKPLWRRPE